MRLGTQANGDPEKETRYLKLPSRLTSWRSKPPPEQSKTDQEAPFAHLSAHEAGVLGRQLEVPPVKVSYLSLYRYATKLDYAIMAVSAIAAIVAGAALPLMTVPFGSLAGTFKGYFNGNVSGPELERKISRLTLYFVYLGIAEFVATFVATVGFIYTGEHIAGKVRQHFLASVLRQNIAYFDRLGAGAITTRITSDTNLIQDGISQKVGLTITALATFSTAYVIGFIKYWKLTLILTSAVIAIFGTMIALGRLAVKWSKASLSAFSDGGIIAEEVISSIRNAVAFGTQDKLAKQYDKHLAIAEKSGFRAKSTLACALGLVVSYMCLAYSLAFWMGSRYLVRGEASLSDVVSIILSVMMGAFALGNIGPNMQAFTSAVAAATKIYESIDRISPLDPTSEEGIKLEQVKGEVELRNIKHIYPSRPEVVVMEDMSLVFPAGKTTALVGESGSGKSTIVGLVERFYNPVNGSVLLDGVDVQNINLRWLRQQISLVSQEPTLFAASVAENIRHGLIGTASENLPETDIQQLVESAAKMANAHDFIRQLPNGYETNVGERGFLLSGGQKQRIAIARAVVSDPKMLLLDEATSALDTKSEGVVQAALDNAVRGRTTIVIAHRLSTIRDADNIVVMEQGRVVEQGVHNQLLEKGGAYSRLVEAQSITAQNAAGGDGDGDSLPVKEFEEDPTDPDLNGEKPSTWFASTSSTSESELPEEGRFHSYSIWSLIKFVASFNKTERWYMVLGLFFAILAGAGSPVQALMYAKCIRYMSLPQTKYAELRSNIDFWAWMYFMLALAQLLNYVVYGVAFAFCSEKLVRRARDTSFRVMLRQEIAFFDQQENSAGSLTSLLSTEATRLAGMSGSTLGTLLLVASTLVVGFSVALAIAWKLALVCIATVPFILYTGYIRFQALSQFEAHAQKAWVASASYACEATSAIRTVASLTREQDVWDNYHEQIKSQEARTIRSVSFSGSLYALGQSLIFFCTALAFWYGGKLIGRGEYNMFQFFAGFMAVIFGAQSAGMVWSFGPEMAKARQTAGEMKALFDRKPEIDTWSTEGEIVSRMVGDIEFRNVHFQYPARSQQPVLRGVDLHIQPGQYAALVGASGCGKSTIIAMLERFYDPTSGGIYIDGNDVRFLNVNSYRSHLALVSQEPTLYQGTIRDNILLGADTEPDDVPEEAIIQACKDANIYDFVLSLPEGFNTVVGNKGSMLSGGQKQRVAIARALLRNPKVLLLDEATSALDSESEVVVQAALDKAAKGRTTIAVAHRLSTIQNADIIFVIDQGRVVESGSHSQLIDQRGRYFELVALQGLGKN